MGARLLEVEDLQTHFIKGNDRVRAVDGVSFHVDENETLGLVGESGCGKTVSCLSVLRLVPKPAGRIVGGKIMFEGQNLLAMSEREMQKLRGNKISMILQDPMTSLNPVFTIGDQIREAIAIHSKLDKASLVSRVIEMLGLVKIPSPETRISGYPHQMSGGMKQRVVGAVCISCRPKLLIADEPTTSLDVTVQAQYLQLLKDIQRELGMALIFITHDFGIVANICDRVAIMYAGRIVESASVRDILYRPAHHYTASLLKAVPTLQTSMERLVSIPGQPPRLDSLPAGCKFAPRCTQPDGDCLQEEPPLIEIADNHYVRCCHHIGS
ncbi:MAG: ABC transporter ATP-binding protein [Dehalococcoidales bacterium]|nr:MAG: ABC transporter ATP-binding protein [Dehalococcoidales bacterium]